MYNAEGRINRIGIMCIDAYGVACKNGFKGTVDEWLASLVGEKGKQGGYYKPTIIHDNLNTATMHFKYYEDVANTPPEEFDFTFSLPHGIQGPIGPKGDPGYSPVKGVDYWTDEDFAQMYDSLAHEFSLGMTFLDHTTGKKCRLYLDNGKFLVEEVG